MELGRRMGRGRGWIIAIVALGVLLLLALGAGFWMWGGYIVALSEAEDAYRQSRPADVEPGSYEFAAHGIAYGMTEEEVEALLEPTEVQPRMKMQERVGGLMQTWNGFVSIYFCEYGETWYNGFTGREEVLAKEEFWVYYDPSGRAVKVLRDVSVGPEWDSMMIDLRTETIRDPGGRRWVSPADPWTAATESPLWLAVQNRGCGPGMAACYNLPPGGLS